MSTTLCQPTTGSQQAVPTQKPGVTRLAYCAVCHAEIHIEAHWLPLCDDPNCFFAYRQTAYAPYTTKADRWPQPVKENS